MVDKQELIRLINKSQKADLVFLGKDWRKPEFSHISTGSLYLDWATNGGVPVGRITEIYGNESSGKSVIASRIIVQAQKKKLTCVWIDSEKSFDPEWMETLGVDTGDLIVSQIAEGESVHDLIFKLVSLGSPYSPEYKDIEPIDLIVLDSVNAITPMAVLDHDMQAHVAPDARMNNQGFRRINARNAGTALVVINQNRSGIGGPRPTDFQPGGRGLKFYASLRIEVRGGDWILPKDIPEYMSIPFNPKDKDTKIGHNIRFRIRKCKAGGPDGKEANLDFYYAGKIDQIKDIISAGRVTEVVEQAGAWYKYEGESYKGAKGFAEFLKSDRAALREIRKKVLEAL